MKKGNGRPGLDPEWLCNHSGSWFLKSFACRISDMSRSPSGKFKLFSLLLLIFFLTLFLSSSPGQAAGDFSSHQAQTAIIVQDDSSAEAVVLQDLLGHFPITAQVVAIEDYRPGSLENYDVAFFVKRDNSPIRSDLLDDIANSSSTIVWIGFGLDQFAAGRSMDRYGFTPEGVSATNEYTHVWYHVRETTTLSPEADLIVLRDTNIAHVNAFMTGSKTVAPYIVNAGKFWVVADVPLKNTTQHNSYMVFADVLHEMVGATNHPTQHLALIRIEDVHPEVEQDKLRAIADYLHSVGIPFSIALIPIYENPATGEQISISDKPGFVDTIHYMEKMGGSIVLHGYTHQYSGETAIDYEFWNGAEDRPPRAESEGWIKEKLSAALNECWRNEIYPVAWVTPHDNASDFTQSVMARYFPVYYGRRGNDFYPYVIEMDHWGQKIIPETMGYVQLQETAGNNRQVPKASELIAVRDSIANAFFHPVMDLDLLKQLTTEVRSAGFQYVSLTSLVGDNEIQPIDLTTKDHIQAWVSGMKRTVEARGTLGLSWMSITGFILLLYYAFIFGLGRRVREPAPVGNPELKFVFIIPALNEELVIARTLRRLLALPDQNVHVLVMNDNSDDRTAEIVEKFKSGRCFLVNRPLSIARRGKGDVLNHAYNHIKSSDLANQAGWDNIIMAVLDADGQVEPNIIKTVTPYFKNPATGAVQASVRIYNADENTLTRWQQFEFLTFNRVFQRGREKLGSVGLGGNGQFVRLAALDSLGDGPWSDCLTEDLDIGVRLMMAGWENHFAGNTFVAQQAVTRLRPLIRQRSRWFQGHVTCWSHIPKILTGNIRLATRIDTIYYLLGIMLVFLFFPASLLFLLTIFAVLLSGASTFGDVFYGGFWPYIVFLYLLSFGPLPLLAYIYWREDGGMSLPKALLRAHIFSVVYYIWFVSGCIAIYRIAVGHHSWAKTARTTESPES